MLDVDLLTEHGLRRAAIVRPGALVSLGMLFGALALTSFARLKGRAQANAPVPLAPSHIAPECGASEYRQFDFWIGEWEVTGDDGQFAGHNRIEAVLRGCALRESWTSAREPYRGESVNTYRLETGTWHQTWIDNMGGSLLLEGKFENGQMKLEGITIDSTGARVVNRIVWSRLAGPGTRVRQHWETSTDGRAWQTSFDGTYVRKR